MSTNYQKKHSDLKKIGIALFIAFLVVVAIFVSGCSTPAVSTPDPEASAASTPSEEPAEPKNDGIFAFGETVTFEDGLSISVSTPAAYTPSDTSAGLVEGQTAVVFEIVLTNNTDEKYEPMVFNSASSGGVEADMIADTEQNVGFPPMTAVLPGQTIKWREAYSVADPNNITLEVSAGFLYDSPIYTNSK